MTPKKPISIYKDVSESLDCKQEIVQDIIEFYYSELRKNLSDLKYPRINIEGLVHLVVKTGYVKKIIPVIQSKLEQHDTSTYGAYFNKKMLENKLELLIQLEQKILIQEKKKLEFKVNKNEQVKKNMERPEQDS